MWEEIGFESKFKLCTSVSAEGNYIGVWIGCRRVSAVEGVVNVGYGVIGQSILLLRVKYDLKGNEYRRGHVWYSVEGFNCYLIVLVID